MKIEVIAEGLEVPWSIDFIDDRTALITERPGRLRLVIDGKLQPKEVKGLPSILNEGQGGLMDVAVDPEYQSNGWVYLSYSHALNTQQGEDRPLAMTRIVRGKIN